MHTHLQKLTQAAMTEENRNEKEAAQRIIDHNLLNRLEQYVAELDTSYQDAIGLWTHRSFSIKAYVTVTGTARKRTRTMAESASSVSSDSSIQAKRKVRKTTGDSSRV